VLTFLSEFGMLFALFAGLVLTVAWRKGWFTEHLADEVSVQSNERGPSFKALFRKSRADNDAGPGLGSADAGNVTVADDVPSSQSDLEGAPDATATAEATRAAQQAAALQFPAFWSREVIQQRAGWMLFEPSDFLGEPDHVYESEIPDSNNVVRIPLFAASRVRELEQENTLIETSRRKVVQARWDRRSATRTEAAE
jgi:hypothetical protein